MTKQTLLAVATMLSGLFSSQMTNAQGCNYTINQNLVNTETPDQNAAFVLKANKYYCVEGDMSQVLGNRKLKIEAGSTLEIKAGAKFTINQFANVAESDGIFKVIVRGSLFFGQTEINTNGVDIVVKNGGVVSRGNNGNVDTSDLKLNNIKTNNSIIVESGGKFFVNTLGVGKDNTTAGRFNFDNYGFIRVKSNINMSAHTVFRNYGLMTVGESFNQNALSKLINCGEMIVATSFNINGGEIINTNKFLSQNGRIDFGNNAGGIFRNYAKVDVKSLNISSTQNAGYFYNEGVVTLSETGSNVFGANVGTLKGPESSYKRGYFNLNSSNKSDIGAIKVSGRLNFRRASANPHNQASDIFNQVTFPNVNLVLATFKNCDGTSACTDNSVAAMPIPNLVYGACTDFDGVFSTPSIILAHDKNADASFEGDLLNTIPVMYAYVVDANNNVIEKIKLTSGANTENQRTNNLNVDANGKALSGNQIKPEQDNYNGYNIVISVLDVPVRSIAPVSQAPDGWEFTKNQVVGNSTVNGDGSTAYLQSNSLSSITFGIKKLATALAKNWTVENYQRGQKVVLGKLSQNHNVELEGNPGDVAIAAYRITELPNASESVLYYDGVLVTGSTIITDLSKLEIMFLRRLNADEILTNTFKYVVIDRVGVSSINEATYTMAAVGPATPLSVKFSSFTVVNVNDKALLEWATASEENSKGFEIERSTNTRDWKSIGFVNSISGDVISDRKYNFVDNTPVNGTNYYRIKQIDNDGKMSLTETRKIILQNINAVIVYPNPANGQFTIKYAQDGDYTIEIFSVNGTLAYTAKMSVIEGDVQKVSASNWSAGVYSVRIKNNNSIDVISLIIN